MKSERQKQKLYGAVVVALVAFSLGFLAQFIFKRPMTDDESIEFLQAIDLTKKGWTFFAPTIEEIRVDVVESLYPYINHFFYQTFGVIELPVRLLFLTYFTIASVLFYLGCTAFFSLGFSLMSGLFFSSTYTLLLYQQFMTRNGGSLIIGSILFFLTSRLFLGPSEREKKVILLVITPVVFFFGFWTYSSFKVLAGVFFTSFFLLQFFRGKNFKNWAQHLVGGAIITVGVLSVAFEITQAAWGHFLFRGLSVDHGEGPWVRYTTNLYQTFISPFVKVEPFYFNSEDTFEILNQGYLPMLFWLPFVFGWFRGWGRSRSERSGGVEFFLTLFFTLATCTLAYGGANSKYILPFYPFYFLMALFPLWDLWNRTKGSLERLGRQWNLIFCTVLLFGFAIWQLKMLPDHYRRSIFVRINSISDEVGEFAEEKAKNFDLVLFHFQFAATKGYYRARFNPKIKFFYEVAHGREIIHKALQKNKRVALVAHAEGALPKIEELKKEFGLPTFYVLGNSTPQ